MSNSRAIEYQDKLDTACAISKCPSVIIQFALPIKDLNFDVAFASHGI
jgi:hypothetical protein